MQLRKEDRPLGELFGDLVEDISALVREEMALARAEMSQRTAHLGQDVGFLAAGGAIAYAGFLAIVFGVIVGLAAAGLPLWGSAFLVGVIVAVVGYFMVRHGLDRIKRSDLTPRETIRTLREFGNGRQTP